MSCAQGDLHIDAAPLGSRFQLSMLFPEVSSWRPLRIERTRMKLSMRRLFQGVEFDGECQLRFKDRNELVEYSEGDLEASVERTHCNGNRIYPDSFEWTGKRPSRSEQMRVFSNVLSFLCGRWGRQVIVVVNVDDARESWWREAGARLAELPIEFEQDSDDQNIAYEMNELLDNIERGGSVQFGSSSALTRSKEEVRQVYAERRESLRVKRQTQRETLEG